MLTDKHVCNMVRSQLEQQGWATAPWCRNRALKELAKLFILESDSPGIYQPGKYSLLRTVQQRDAREASKSALRGLNPFPLHTDEAARRVPPRYILMRLLSGSSKAETYLLHFPSSQISPQLLADLAGGLWTCRGARGPHISSVWKHERTRWDEDCMRPVDRLAKRAHSRFLDFPVSAPMVGHKYSDHSEALLIDNWRTMHGRVHVLYREHRQLERVYVEMI